MSEKRQVLPGLFYREPPAQDKLDFHGETAERLRQSLEAVDHPTALDRWLMDRYAGISPLIARELAFLTTGRTDPDLTGLDRASLAAALFGALQGLGADFVPTCLYLNGERKDFSFRPIRQYEGYMTEARFPGFSELLDDFYSGRALAERMRARTQTMHKTLSNQLARVRRKLANQEKELEATYDRERLRQLGDIVTANLHLIQRGQARLTATDFYDPE